METSTEACALCERELPLTFHHLIPKKVHKKSQVMRKYTKEEIHTKGLWLCTDCHATIHLHINHLDLALHYQTVEAFMAHEQVGKFVNWVANQNKRVKKRPTNQ